MLAGDRGWWHHLHTLFLLCSSRQVLPPLSQLGHCAYAPLLPHSSQQMPVSHSYSAVWRRASISQRGGFTHVWWSRFYIWCPGFGGCFPGDTPWSPGSRGQRALCSWVSWDSNNQTASSGQTTMPRTLHRQQTETLPFFLWRRCFCLTWSFDRRGRLQDWHISRVLWRYSQRT